MNQALRTRPSSPSRKLREARAARRLIAILTVVLVAVSAWVVISYQQAIRIPPNSGGPAAPVKVQISSLGVVAPVSPVRIQGSVLNPPDDPRMAGWWLDGAQPGARTGSVVITAHKIHGGGGAFDALGKVKRGSLVSVDTTAGVQNYAISSVKDFNQEEFAAAAPELFRTDGKPRLVLITCWGWNGRGWDGNTVAIAEPDSGS